ncbi:hypothetical protein M758_8G154100 [Ceratodon purpureus]|nr:hypothetical protein M758_8G154100 [Ceratodon purpureus]
MATNIRVHLYLCTFLLLLSHSRISCSLRGVEAVPVNHPQAQTYVNRKLRASTPSCTKADISITQGKSGNSNGIPAFSVQITNLCVNHNCQLQNIHVACAAFASARPLDSRVFQRIKYNDCLVMGGAPLRAGGSVAFEYANSSEYPMHVISADLGPCS